jgi:hypothetical protein
VEVRPLALPFFAITLFVSAFQLFLVQPMIGQMILPKLGGTPSVWNTCMVFFQSALLAGYAYTHTVSTHFPLRRQIVLHGILLLTPLIVLLPKGPFYVTDWEPTFGANPIGDTLLLLAMVVGLPFFVVSTSAPLLQKWFGATGHPSAKDPYFLYGASNLGSMLALIAYPIVVEPYLPLRTQAVVWLIGYFVLVALYVVCAAMVWTSPLSLQLAAASGPDLAPVGDDPAPMPPPEAAAKVTSPISAAPLPAPKPAATGITAKFGKKGKKPPARPVAADLTPVKPTWVEPPPDDDITIWRRIRWVLLAACPTSLMLGVSSFISTDISAIPLFWVVPLALYLLTFILVFLRWPVPWTHGPHSFMVLIQPIFVMLMAFLVLLLPRVHEVKQPLSLSILGFFLTAVVCHGELARDRPSARHLTEFFLLMSFGGMLGGMFNGLFAPLLFVGIVEYPLALVLGCLLRPLSRHLAPIERDVGVPLGAFFGFLLGMSLASWTFAPMSLLLSVLAAAAGALLAYLYKPSPRENSWTDEYLMNAFPGLADWAKKTSQDLAARFGRSVKAGSTFVLNYGLDITLGLFTAFLAYWLISSNRGGGWLNNVNLFKFLKNFISEASAREYVRNFSHVLVFGIPMLMCFFFASRPIRFGLAFGGLIVVNALYMQGRGEDRLLAAVRSYFGQLRVYESDDMREYQDGSTKINSKHTYLMHGTTHHGLNYHFPKDLSRVTTTYYHQYGPAGIVMERYNWFGDRPTLYMATPAAENGAFIPALLDAPAHNTYAVDLNKDKKKGSLQNYYCYRASDARLAASLAGLGAASAGLPLPTAALTGMWSEPPYATIGLGTGTMASYARPYQHMHYYEIDNHIRRFNLPVDDDTEPFFVYLKQAKKRGAVIEVLMGDARLRMARPYKPYREEAELNNEGDGGGPDLFYHMMVVDAFSSDAIPRHLITKEALEMYFKKLAPGGILCVHTSNRHIDLVPVVANAAAHAEFDEVDRATGNYKTVNGARVKTTGLVSMRAHDPGPFLYKVNTDLPHNIGAWANTNSNPGHSGGHYTSEWVMVARNWEDLKGHANSDWKGLQAPAKYEMAEKMLLAIDYLKPGYAESWAKLEPLSLDERFKTFWTEVPENVKEAVAKRYDPYFEELVIKDGILNPFGSEFEKERRGPTTLGSPWTDDFSNVWKALRWR